MTLFPGVCSRWFLRGIRRPSSIWSANSASRRHPLLTDSAPLPRWCSSSVDGSKAPSVEDPAPTVPVTFSFADGSQRSVSAKVGSNLLDVVLENDVDIDGFGACEGTLACSTCHLVLSRRLYDSIGQELSDEELDMLDLAFGLEETSRLGCQCVVDERYEGETLQVPASTNDLRAE